MDDLRVSISEVISESGISVNRIQLISEKILRCTSRNEFLVGNTANRVVDIGVDVIVELSNVSIEDVTLLNHNRRQLKCSKLAYQLSVRWYTNVTCADRTELLILTNCDNDLKCAELL